MNTLQLRLSPKMLTSAAKGVAWAGCLLLAAVAQSAHAAFPDKPVRVVIGFPAGGPLDQHARLLTERLQAVLGQPIIIDYKSGAGGTVGAQEVIKAPADGYTLMLANTGVMVINPALYTRLPYSTLRDFTPIARTAMQPLALLVNPKVPVNSLKEFIDYSRARPGQVNYGSAGNGGISHLVPEMFKNATGLFMVHIPYRGSAPAFTDLMAGQVQFMGESIPQAAAYHKQGKVRALAVTSKERNPALPDVPTVIESGIMGFEVVGFYGFLAPAGLPKDVTAKLSEAFRQVMASPDIRSRMVAQGADPAFMGSEEFAQFLATETPRWAQAVKASGAKLD
ncbi:MAG: LacI family transcriptional regulator [Polaromonas sp. 39-63-203]|jgi:tripartite-type tricarboxylate transporter receptor subunit TctC|nr:MAG: LacI family transcriptional regulator [Polaromonas sp. 24-62-144]OZA94132.1 MAG: LacI family transcriptional regulator [Polaromonas sp. 39-63-203]